MAKMDEVGSKYDREVIEWRDNIVKRMQSAGVHVSYNRVMYCTHGNFHWTAIYLSK